MDAKELGALQAYPDPRSGDSTGNGLTKRELFAAMAMQSIIAKNPCADVYADGRGEEKYREQIDAIVSGAVDHADALLAELAKEQP